MGNIESAVAHAAISVVGAVSGAKQISTQDMSLGMKARLEELAKIRAKGTFTVNDQIRLSEIELELERVKDLTKRRQDGTILSVEQEELDAWNEDRYIEWKSKQPKGSVDPDQPRFLFPEHAPKDVFNLAVRPIDHIAARLRPVDDKKNNIGSSLARDLGM